ncbi:DUF6896 domain-containing protein [Flavobacterium polysaccharolyticum]|uniref:DUF6896 domain-containing protein n=1 Tax=Flavobacterium polysaccharolyticum TaxID=3133148 RepID=A0ABU9NNL1_9FLAO
MKTSEEELLIEAIILFEEKASEMINLLAEKFQLDLSRHNPFSKLLLRQNNLWKGNLNEEWIYWFHGDACDFENIKTKQYIHVKINRASNYGAIDNFYLFKFIRTSDSLRNVSEIINSESMFNEILSNLEKNKIVVNIDKWPLQTRVLNKTTFIT